MADFYTEQMNIRSGQLTVTIVDADSSVTPLEATIDLESMSDIKFENDVPDNEEDPSTLGVNAGSLDLVFWDEAVDENGDRFSLINHFTENESGLDYPKEILAELVRDGNTYKFIFEFFYSDLDDSFEERKFMINAHAKDRTDISEDLLSRMDDFTAQSTELDTGGQFSETIQVLPAGFFLTQAVIEGYFGMGADNVIISDRLSNQDPTDSELEWYFWWEDGTTNLWTYGSNTVHDLLANMAALDGAFFGFAFNTAFFVSRTAYDANYHVNIPWSEVEKLEVVGRRNIKIRQVQESVLVREDDPVIPIDNTYSLWNSEYGHIATGETNGVYPLEERKLLEVAFPKMVATLGTYNSGTDIVDWAGKTTHDNEMAQWVEDGSEIYANAVGALAPLRIEFTVWGVDTTKPFNSFSFTGTDVPDFLAGKTFRMSNGDYSLTEDKIVMEAYEFNV